MTENTSIVVLTPYQAKHDDIFDGYCRVTRKECKITAFQMLANLIDDDWKYSWHWSSDPVEALTQIERDLKKQTVEAKKQLHLLHVAKMIFDQIEKP